MKKIFLYCSILFSFISQAQISKISRDLINTQLYFFMPKDSISGLYEYQEGSGYVVNGDTIDIVDFMHEEEGFYTGTEDSLKAYLLYRPVMMEKGILATLTFCKDRLIQISMYTNRSYYVGNFELEKQRYFKHYTSGAIRLDADSVSNQLQYGTRAVTYEAMGSGHHMAYAFYENLVTGSGSFMLCDKGFDKRMPSFCLNCNGRRTWAKLYKYVEKKSAGEKKEYKRSRYNYV